MTKQDSGQKTLVIAATIGAIGGIFAACIGLLPTVLPMVRPTSTPPFVVITATFPPTDTPAPLTPSATTAPTDLPTFTASATIEPILTTPTETPTVIPTPASSSSELDDYVGTWKNIDEEPASDTVRLILTRIEISKASDTTANFVVCRAAQQKKEIYVQPNPGPATMYAFGLGARDFVISRYENLRWAVIVQRSDDQLVATVQEYDTNNVLLNSETFQLEKPTLIDSITLPACEEPDS
ncbi:MAG: hypothetical protein ABI621_11895 [Chloroflexota bacterium]